MTITNLNSSKGFENIVDSFNNGQLGELSNLGDSWNLGHLGDMANVGILGQ